MRDRRQVGEKTNAARMATLAAEKTKRIRILRMDESTVCDVDVKTAGLLQQAAEADFRILDELEEIRRPEKDRSSSYCWTGQQRRRQGVRHA